MDVAADITEASDAREFDRQLALLNWARAKIDLQSRRGNSSRTLDGLFDFMESFTREYFGFQERLLRETNAPQEHLLERLTTHAGFLRRLTRLRSEIETGKSEVSVDLNALCQELWMDVQAQRDSFSEIVRRGQNVPKLRKELRPDSEALLAILRADF